MSGWKLSKRSRDKLVGVHPSLQILMKAALETSPLDFGITEGLRTLDTQKLYFENGKSKTMNSKHLKGLAVDIVVFVDGKVTWDLEHYKTVAAHIKKVAEELKIPIVWGGDWKSFIDGPHFELKL